MKKAILVLCVGFFLISFKLRSQPSNAYIDSVMSYEHLPGMECLIIKDGKWVWYGNWGKANVSTQEPVSIDNIFMLASVSKLFITTAVMQLWEEGRVSLDTNVDRYLPFTVENPHYAGTAITLRMLLSHTSSIKDNDTLSAINDIPHGDSPIALSDLCYKYFTPGQDYYSATHNFYNYNPGTRDNYSNMGATLAAYVVESVTQEPFYQYCQQRIFDSLCMSNTSYMLSGIGDTSLIARPESWSNTGYDYVDDGLYGFPDYPDGQARTTITSLSRFMDMYMHHGVYNGVRLLDSATVDTIMAQQFAGAPGAAGWGLGFYDTVYANGDSLSGHAGGYWGVATEFWYNYPESNIGIIILSNGDGFGVATDTLVDTLYRYAKTITVVPADTFPLACNMATGYGLIKHGGKAVVQVYPDPNEGRFAIQMLNNEQGICNLEVYNTLGQQILTKTLNDAQGDNNVNMSNQPGGVYLYRIVTLTGNIIKQGKLVIQK